jgi:YD repeat-containing protein
MDEETFQTELGRGQFIQRSMDLQLDSLPPIEFRRGYLSTYNVPMAFGYGASHHYNSRLNSDGAVNLTFIDIIHEDGSSDHLRRITPGRGFSVTVAFESEDDGQEIYGSRLKWASDRFKLTNRDGSWSTYLPCADDRCYWVGYQDSKGNALRFDRGSRLELQRLTSQDQKGIEFQSDDQVRITDAKATDGRHVSYAYSAAGDLTEVKRADGQTTLYSYDDAHHMTSVAVQSPGQAPRVLITNEYDDQGWLVRQTLADGNVYTMKYGAIANKVARRVVLHEPSGRTLDIRLSDSDFEARSTPVRFAAKPNNSQDAQK